MASFIRFENIATKLLTGRLPRSARLRLDITRRDNTLIISGWRIAIPSTHDRNEEKILFSRKLEMPIETTVASDVADQLSKLPASKLGVDIGLVSEHTGLTLGGVLARELEARVRGETVDQPRITGHETALQVKQETQALCATLGIEVIEKIDAFFGEEAAALRRTQTEDFSAMKPALDSKNALAAVQDAAYAQREILAHLFIKTQAEAAKAESRIVCPARVQELLTERIDKMIEPPYQDIDPSFHASPELRERNARYVQAWKELSIRLRTLLDRVFEGDASAIKETNDLLLPTGVKFIERDGQIRGTLAGKIIILSGPSGSGKGTVQAMLLEQGCLKFVFVTTRKPRPGESHGTHYFFLSQEEAQRMAEAEPPLSAVKVHGDLQVIPQGLVEVAEKGLTVFTEVDTNHALNVRAALIAAGDYIDAEFIFLRTPDAQEQELRLAGRKTEPPSKMKTRVTDAALEIRRSSRVHEIIINNDNLFTAAIELLTIVGLIDETGAFVPHDAATTEEKTGRQISGQANGKSTLMAYQEIADRLDVAPVGTYALRGTTTPTEASQINEQELAAFRENLTRMYFDGYGNVKPRVPAPVGEELIINAAQVVGKRFPHWRGKAADVRVGLHPGTMNPPTYGHLSASIAAVIGHGLNGILEMPGGNIPDKPLAASFEHRMQMLRLATTDAVVAEWAQRKGIESRFSLPSNVRQQMVETFSDNFLGTASFFAASPAERRARRDIAAFALLAALNPRVQFTYVVGSDKVLGYADPKRNEGALLRTLEALGIDILYFGREGEAVNWADIAYAEGLYAKRPKALGGSGKFNPCPVPSFDMSATDLRVRIAQGLPIDDLTPRSVIEYIYSAHNPLWRLYALEQKIKEVGSKLQAARQKGNAAVVAKIQNEDRPAIIAELESLKSLGLLQRDATFDSILK